MRMCRGKTRNFYEYGKAALDSSGNNNKLTNFKQKRWQSEKKEESRAPNDGVRMGENVIRAEQ